MKKIYLLVGSPGSGKTWIGEQLKESFHFLEHDHYKGLPAYFKALRDAQITSRKPVLGNTPFGVSQFIEELDCTPIFVIEAEDTLRDRYFNREGKAIPQGHLTRQNTYIERAKLLKAFSGTSSEVLSHLRLLGR